MQNLQAGHVHVFPHDSAPGLAFRRSSDRPGLCGSDLRLARQARERLAGDPLGDGMKLSVMGIGQESPSSVLFDVSGIRFSEICGAVRGVSGLDAARASEAFSSKAVRVLLSNNILVSRDRRIILSRTAGSDLRTSLNGFVDSDTMQGIVDKSLIERTAAIELFEEYGISRMLRHDVHSIHVTSSRSLPLAVRVFGSVHLDLTFKEITESKESARDSWENPLLHAIDESSKAIDGIAGALPYVGPMLRAYAARVL